MATTLPSLLYNVASVFSLFTDGLKVGELSVHNSFFHVPSCVLYASTKPQHTALQLNLLTARSNANYTCTFSMEYLVRVLLVLDWVT